MASSRPRTDYWLSTQGGRLQMPSRSHSRCVSRKIEEMGTIVEPLSETPTKKRNLVEMNWDPITRIVGSLGIFTKIDFENQASSGVPQHLVHLPWLQHFHEGKDPRDAHFITSRICGICGDNHATCASYAQNMAFGVRRRRWESGLSISEKPPSTCSTTTSFRTTWWAWISASRW